MECLLKGKNLTCDLTIDYILISETVRSQCFEVPLQGITALGMIFADCRSEPQHWYSLAGNYQLLAGNDVTKLQSPAAYLVDDEEEAKYMYEGESPK